ncbi:hypothetical protein C8D89_10467 [Actinomycetospora cinnamomea]|uniref:Uncharacterized protein n=1 Tax=Actinomycetospora cinnamomea TaxID=663609 RepID=A0A2U1FFE4_9PSEU|nr:hypothetical protein C8D89_10467 [Actinomycetospora cinnamomea]
MAGTTCSTNGSAVRRVWAMTRGIDAALLARFPELLTEPTD